MSAKKAGQASADTPAPAVPADRYGKPHDSHSKRRVIWISSAVGAVVLALVIAWFAWTDVLGLGPSASARDTGFAITNDHLIHIDFEVTATPQRDVACTLKALNESFTIVGWKVVTYPASPERIRSFTESINTLERPVTGLVADCWLT